MMAGPQQDSGIDWDSLLEGSPEGGGAPTADSGIDWDKSAESGKVTPLTQFQQPEMMDDPENSRGASMGDVAKASFASHYGEAVRFYAKQMYPDEPPEKSVKRFGVSDGDLYHVPDLNKPGEAYMVAPGFMRGVAAGAGPSLPAVAGVGTGIITMPMAEVPGGLPASMALTGAAASGGESVRQQLGDIMMGSKGSDADIAAGPVIGEGITHAAGQGIGKGMINYTERNLVKDINRMDPQKTARAYGEGEDAGIKITAPEATDLASLKAKQKRLAQNPATMDKADDFYTERNRTIANVWDGFLDDISKIGDVDDAARMARDAAQKAQKRVKESRRSKASPEYKESFEEAPPVDMTPVSAYLEKELQFAKGGIREALERAKGYLQLQVQGQGGKAKMVWDQRLESLHQAKVAIDDMMSGGQDRSLGNISKGKLKDLQDILLQQMDEASEQYGRARGIFSEESTFVDQLTDSTVTLLAKLQDMKLGKFAMDVLNPRLRTPAAVARAKEAISREDPEAWKALNRIFMQGEALSAWKPSTYGGTVNPAGKLWQKFWGNEQMRQNLKAAMDPRQWSFFTKLMNVMKTASRVKNMGSDTAQNLVMEAQEQAAARPFWAKMLRVTKWPERLDEFFTNRAMDKNAEKWGRLVFDMAGDPRAVGMMKELQKLQPGSLRWRAALGQLLATAGKEGVEELFEPSSVPGSFKPYPGRRTPRPATPVLTDPNF